MSPTLEGTSVATRSGPPGGVAKTENRSRSIFISARSMSGEDAKS
jgi:hypothetical protein